MPEFQLTGDMLMDGKILVARLAVLAGLCSSVSEARRSIEQGGLRLNGEKIGDTALELDLASLEGAVLQKGKRAFARIRS